MLRKTVGFLVPACALVVHGCADAPDGKTGASSTAAMDATQWAGPLRELVRTYYVSFLHRQPSNSEVEGHVNGLLTSTGVDRMALAAMFETSPESRSNVETRERYRKYLGRDPAQDEIDSWVAQLDAGLDPEQFTRGILSSPEYWS